MEIVIVLGALGLSYLVSSWKYDKMDRMKVRAAAREAEDRQREQEERDAIKLKREAEEVLLLRREERELAREDLARINVWRQINELDPVQSIADLMSHLAQEYPAELKLLKENPESSSYFHVAQLLVNKRREQQHEDNNYHTEEVELV